MRKVLTLACLFATLLMAACTPGPAPQPTPVVTELLQPATPTQPAPTGTPLPTSTAAPATATSAPTSALTATPQATAVVSGTVVPPSIAASGVLSADDFEIGTVAGVADSWFASITNGVPYEPGGPPPLRGWPPYLFVTFEEAGRPEADLGSFTVNAPQGRVFPVEAFRAMFAQTDREIVGQWIDELHRILAERPQTFADPIPVLPDVGATQDLRAKVTYIDFTGGSGIGFVGHYAQGPEPFTNENLAYFFQGLTSDGKQYLSFVQPLSTNFLPENRAAVPQEALDALGSDPRAYLQETAQAIDRAGNSDFTPNLDALIAMYRSIVIGSTGTGVPTLGTPGAGTQAAGTPAPTLGSPRTTTTPTSAAQGLAGFLWAWEELRGAGDDNLVVSEPLSYTLSLLPDGSLAARADCNQAGGRYTLGAGGAITIDIGSVTKVACAEGSHSEEYLAKLESAEVYEISGGKLELELQEGEGQMVFGAGRREIEIAAEPGDGAATVTTREVINILSGPGGSYPSYGTVPAGTVLEVVGKSQDGAWWVVRLPEEILEDGQGWVAGRYVEAENTEAVPVVQPPTP